MKRHDTAPGEQSKKYRPLFLDHFDKKEQEKRARSKGSKDNSPLEQLAPQQYVGTGRPIVTQQHPTSQSSQLPLEEKQLLQQPQHSQQQQPQPSTVHHQQHQQQQQQIQLQQQQQQVQNSQAFEDQQGGDGTMVYSPTALIHSQPKPMSAEEQQKFENNLQRQLVQMNKPANHQPLPSRGVAAENQPKFQRSFIDGDFDFLKNLTYEELHQRMATLDQEMEREIDELRQRYHAKRQPILDAMDQKRKRQQNF